MTKAAFPLSKSNSGILGSGWNWAVFAIKNDDDTHRYRLLVGYHEGKEQYRAWLGLEVGADQAVLARLEYHPDDAHGWHCHLKKGLVSEVAVGVVKQSRYRDQSRSCRASNEFGVSTLNALRIACRVFNILPTYEDSELLQ